MNILVVSATHFEIQPLLDFLNIKQPIIGLNKASHPVLSSHVNILITGIGMIETAFMMGKLMGDSNDIIINVGVCGAFDKTWPLGEVVHVTEDILSELGAEDDERFLTYNQLNLPGEHIFSPILHKTYPTINSLRKVKGITVNTIHGSSESIKKIQQLYQPDVESMEGAAFFRACKGVKEPHFQIRAISNYVEKRDKCKWQMPLAIKNMNDFLFSFIKEISH